MKIGVQLGFSHNCADFAALKDLGENFLDDFCLPTG